METTEMLAADLFLHKSEAEKEMSVFALYTNQTDVEVARITLIENGILSEDISMLAPTRGGGHDFVYRQHTQLFQGAVIGAILGFIAGGSAGFFVDMQALFFVDTALPPLLIEPYLPMSNVLWSAFIGLLLGACCGALVGIGTTASAARRYAFYLTEGGIILVVRLKNLAHQKIVSSILEKNQGQDINTLKEQKIWSTIIPEKRRLTDVNNKT